MSSDLSLPADEYINPTIDSNPQEISTTAAADTEQDPDCDARMPSYFAERDEILNIISSAIDLLPKDGSEKVVKMGDDNGTGIASQLYKMELILSRYQECPTLLLPELESLISPFLNMVVERIPRASDINKLNVNDGNPEVIAEEEYKNKSNGSTGMNGKNGVDGYYDECDEYDGDAAKSSLHHACRALYFIVKVAGPKACTSYFPHDVKLLEDVFYCLRRWQTTAHLQVEWEVRYCLLLWISNLILVPFALSTIDSNQGDDTGSLSQRLMDCAWRLMSDSSKCREGAALLLARLNTRPDAECHRRIFFERAITTIKSGDSTPINGVLQVIAATYKSGKRKELMPYATEDLINLVGVVTESKDVWTAKTAMKVVQRLGISLLPQRSASWKYALHKESLEANLRQTAAHDSSVTISSKQDVKEEQTNEEDIKESDLAVPAQCEDVIGYLLLGLSHRDTVVRWSAAKGIGPHVREAPKLMCADVILAVIEMFDEALYENSNGWHGGCLALAELCKRSTLLPQQMDKVIPIVTKGLLYELSRGTFSIGSSVRDAACYVCWSVARAYNPKDLEKYAKELSITLVIASLFDREVSVRRAASAALQECVGRLGNFPDGIELVTTMDFFSLATRRNSYLNITPLVSRLPLYRPEMVKHLINVKLNHWDSSVRALAAKAIGSIAVVDQELIIGYLPSLIQCASGTTEVTIRHGRILAVAEIIKNLARGALNQEMVQSIVNIIPTLESKRYFRGRGCEFIRQACCVLVASFSSIKNSFEVLPEHVEIIKITGQIGKAGTKGQIQKFLEDCWKQPLEWLQSEAVHAFRLFSNCFYGSFVPTFHNKMFKAMRDGISLEKPPNERRGNLLALGAIPLTIALAPIDNTITSHNVPSVKGAASVTKENENLLCQGVAPCQEASVDHHICHWEVALDDICAKTKLEENKDDQDAESRRNAVISMTTLAETLGEHITSDGLRKMCETIFIYSMNDYAVDKRGDIGSFARIEGIRALPKILKIAMQHNLIKVEDDQNHDLIIRSIHAITKQAVEKIDRVRGIAGAELINLLTLSVTTDAHDVTMDNVDVIKTDKGERHLGPVIMAILSAIDVKQASSSESLNKRPLYHVSSVEAFHRIVTADVVDWASPNQSFPTLTQDLLLIDLFSVPVIEGIIVSVGGLSIHVAKSSQVALFAAFKKDSRLMSKMVVLAAASQIHVDRFIVPLAVTLEKLISARLIHPSTYLMC